MYNYNISDDVTNEVLSLNTAETKKKKVDDLLSTIDKIQSSVTPTTTTDVGENITLTKKEMPTTTEAEISQLAEQSLASYKNESEKAIADENQAKQEELLSNRETVKEETAAQKESLQSYYDTAKQNTSDEALSRGLARSSIVINQLGAFDQDQIDKYAALDAELSDNISAIEFELSGLNTELETALGDFDVTYAVKLQEKINELNQDLKEQQESVVEYNNEIALQEAEFNKSLTELKNEMQDTGFDQSTDLLEIYGKYGSNVVNKYVSDSIYSATKAYLDTLSKEEALEVLNDEQIKAKLGTLYDTLLKAYT